MRKLLPITMVLIIWVFLTGNTFTQTALNQQISEISDLVWASSENGEEMEEMPFQSSLVLLFTGDNLLGARMGSYIERSGESYPYEKVATVLQEADLSFGNLESPITDYGHPTPGKSAESIRAGRNFIFKASPQYSGRILEQAGFDIVSLANNHAMDYQEEGLLQTLDELKKVGIVYVGAGGDQFEAASGRIITKNGYWIGFLAYSMIVPAASSASVDSAGINAHPKSFSSSMTEAIQQLRAKTDLVIVSYHWGVEGSYYPVAYQKEVAHQAIEAGADIVVGHHPHRVQGIEFYQKGIISYSLGNFLFTGKSSPVESLILRVEVSDGKVKAVKILPIWVKNGRPEPSDNSKLIEKLKQINRPFATTLELEGNWLIAWG